MPVAVADYLIHRLLGMLGGLPEWVQSIVWLLLLLVFIQAASASPSTLRWVFGFRMRGRGTGTIDYQSACSLTGLIVKDLTYAAYRMRSGGPGRTLESARDALLHGILKVLGRRGKTDVRACIFVHRSDVLVIDRAAGYSAQAVENLQLEIEDTIAGEAYDTLKTRYCHDRIRHPGFKDHPLRTRDYRSILCIPLSCGNNAYGVLNIDAAPVRAFSESEVAALEALARLASLSYVLERGDVNGRSVDRPQG